MTPLFALVYTSTSIRPYNLTFIREILEQSRKNNLRDDLTGFLIEREGFFLQLLEGEKTKVQDCFERIKTDLRHSAVVLQGAADIQERAMPDWRMAYFSPDTRISATDGLLALFELGRQGKQYTDQTALMSLVQMFARNSTALIANS